MVGLVPTIHRPAGSQRALLRARQRISTHATGGSMDPRDKPEDDNRGNIHQLAPALAYGWIPVTSAGMTIVRLRA
jgi:hypothetical protein